MNVYVSNQSSYNRSWFEFSDDRFKSLQQKIQQETNEHILNVNEADYKAYLLYEFGLEPLVIHEDTQDVQPPQEKQRELSEQDRFFNSPYYYECSVAYSVEGSRELWAVQPTVYSSSGRPNFAVSRGKITFQFLIQSQEVDEYLREKNNAFNLLKGHIEAINNDAAQFNSELPARVSRYFGELKEKYLKENSFFASINVKQNPDAPRTYSVRRIEKRPPIQKPTATTKSYTSEPTVDGKAYNDIIDCLTRVGLSIERKPSLYVDKDEEALRDLFLMQLELAFLGGTATGETFNRSGKTDILLKNIDNTNLFVGECKVWKGSKHYLEAISQLLEYLTWGDSKTALLVFVKSVSLSTVIQAVKQVTLTHPSAVRLVGVRNERFLQFTFKLPQDDQKQVAIEVMLFHFDKQTEGRG